MKKLLLLFSGLLLSTWTFGQCTPMTDFGDEPYGVAPDTVENFVDGMVNSVYSQQIDVKVPVDGGFAGAPFIEVDSAEVISIDGLPPGLTVDCAENAVTECTYLPGTVGCAVITGIPTSGGEYELVVNLRVYTTVIPYDLPFTGYKIFIEGSSGLDAYGDLSFQLASPRPNPSDEAATIGISARKSGEAVFQVFDLVGKRVFSNTVRLSQGENTIRYETAQLPEGVYIYRVDAFGETMTSRLVIAH